MNQRRLFDYFLSLLLLLTLAACGPLGNTGEEATLTIAVIAPFSGSYAVMGQSVQNGVVLAVETWNAEGGVLDRPIQVVLRDDLCDYTTAREVAAAVVEEGIGFIIGAVCATASESVAQVATESSVLQISPASVNLDLTLNEDGSLRPTVFRVPFADPDQGTVAAKLAWNQLQAKTAAVITPEDNDYTAALAGAFQTEFVKLGGEIIKQDTYDQNAELFYDVLDPVREADPDVIYAPGYFNVMNRLLQQARLYGMAVPFIGSDGWDSPELDLQWADGCYYTTHYFAGEGRLTVQQWIRAYETRFIVAPDTLATLGYDAANLLLTAIRDSESLEPGAVAAYMATMSFDAVSGWLQFDAAHNPTKSVIVLQVAAGELRFHSRIYAADIESQ